MSEENKAALESLHKALCALPPPDQEYMAGYAAGVLAVRQRTEDEAAAQPTERAS